MARYNVSEETIELENIITEALSLLKKDKVAEAIKLLTKENDRINRSYGN